VAARGAAGASGSVPSRHEVVEPGRISAHRQAKPGDAVFALKQGDGAKGIFATGRIVSPPQPVADRQKGRGSHEADIAFDRLVDPLVEFLVDEEATRAILQGLIKARASGNSIPDDVARRLQLAIARSWRGSSNVLAWQLGQPAADDYVAALQATPLSDTDLRMLRCHYEADAQTITPRQLSEHMGWDGPNAAKLHYGHLAGRIKDALGGIPSPSGDPYHVGVIARASWPAEGELQWEMYPALALALTRVLFRGDDAGGDDASSDDAGANSIEELRARAYSAAGVGVGPVGTSMRNVYQRSEDVRAYVLRRADGTCEACRQPAPFRRADGSDYLEPHHTQRRTDGGPDHPKFVGAICPNCHRRIHHGCDGLEVNERLKAYIAEAEENRGPIRGGKAR